MKILIRAGIFFAIVFLSAFFFFQSDAFPGFVTYGGIYSRQLSYGSTVIFGTSYTKLNFWNSESGNVRSVDLNTGNVDPQLIIGRSVIALSGDSVFRVDIKTGKILWKYTHPNGYDLIRVVSAQNVLLVSAKDGSLIALHSGNGSRAWSIASKPLTSVSAILINGSPRYFGDFIVVEGVIYRGSMDGTVSAHAASTGKTLWSRSLGGPIVSGPDHYGQFLIVSTGERKLYAIHRNTGQILWQQQTESPILCSDITSTFSLSRNPVFVLLGGLIEHLRNYRAIGGVSYFDVQANGVFERRDGKTGKILWKSSPLGKSVNCPTRWFSRALITTGEGSVINLSLRTGNIFWVKKGLGPIAQSAALIPNLLQLPPWVQGFTNPSFLISTLAGNAYALQNGDGHTKWQFATDGPLYAPPLFHGNWLYLGTADGALFRLRKDSGPLPLSRQYRSFHVSSVVHAVGNDAVIELTVKNEGQFENPWREVSLQGVFTDPSGKTIRIPGFYYDTNEWKIRLNAPLRGIWKWNVVWVPFGRTYEQKGQTVVSMQPFPSFVHLNAKNPKRLTVDGTTIFNGIGLGDSMFDANANGTMLDDWALGNSRPITATDSSGFTLQIRSDKVNTLSDYVRTYGLNGAGFNMFRWSLLNATGGLWRDLGFPMIYSIHDGKIGDNLVRTLRAGNIHVWLTLFGFNVPFQTSLSPAERALLRSYIRYVVARYGAFVDVWELANEVTLPKETILFLIKTLHEFDDRKRPISTSFEEPEMAGIDIISPHWYQTEPISESDQETMKRIQAFEHVQKPVVFGEQGNIDENWDATSALRMRIRSWTAFFSEGILMFWNQSEEKGMKHGIYPNANLFLGEEERGYIKALQQFTSGIPLTAQKISFPFRSPDVRGYGLTYHQGTRGYFVHWASSTSPTQVAFTFPIKDHSTIDWVDTATGTILQQTECGPGPCTLVSPQFVTDIALRIQSQKASQ